MVDVDPTDVARDASVRPAGWRSPVPGERYALVVIGGGPAGLVAAMGAAGLGARVALVESDRLGGDCLNVGCVPSKALLAAAHAASDARRAGRLGVTAPPVVDFGAALARVREVRAEVARNDAAQRLADAGVDVFFGAAKLLDAERVDVSGVVLRGARLLIATGARAVVPDIPGLAELEPWTNEAVFDLRAAPAHLLVLGGGAIGCEMAQAFAALGVRVTLLERGPRLLPRDAPRAAELLARRLREEGVEIVLGAAVSRAWREGEARCVAWTEDGGCERSAAGDAVLVALGRAPRVEGLGLEAAGIDVGPRGIRVDAYLRTRQPHVFAAGDVVGLSPYTHGADAMARAVVQNALFWPSQRFDPDAVPRVTYTEPEVAHVGPTWDALSARRDLVEVAVSWSELDRAVTASEAEGEVRVWADARGRIIAASAVGHGAGEVLGALALCRQRGVRLGALSGVILPYPTYVEALRKLGDRWRRRALTPRVASWIRGWLRWWFGRGAAR
jgi:pyruvate/2-oxoglutarate dehydrogenase complex dihydrolipoamide dehydrogenase (E3) component